MQAGEPQPTKCPRCGQEKMVQGLTDPEPGRFEEHNWPVSPEWFGIYEFYDPVSPRLIRLVRAADRHAAIGKAVFGDEASGKGIAQTRHVHAVPLADYVVPSKRPVRTWDGEKWEDPA